MISLTLVTLASYGVLSYHAMEGGNMADKRTVRLTGDAAAIVNDFCARTGVTKTRIVSDAIHAAFPNLRRLALTLRPQCRRMRRSA